MHALHAALHACMCHSVSVLNQQKYFSTSSWELNELESGLYPFSNSKIHMLMTSEFSLDEPGRVISLFPKAMSCPSCKTSQGTPREWPLYLQQKSQRNDTVKYYCTNDGTWFWLNLSRLSNFWSNIWVYLLMGISKCIAWQYSLWYRPHNCAIQHICLYPPEDIPTCSDQHDYFWM